MYILTKTLIYSLSILEFIVFLRMLLTWYYKDTKHKLLVVLERFSEPMLIPFNKVLKFFKIKQSLDFSGLLIFIFVEVLKRT